MRKLMIGLLSLCLAVTAIAGTIVVQTSDEVIGYDGDCQVYFRPDLGFFEVCPSAEPVILGASFDTISFHRGFHFREGITRERVNTMTVNRNTDVNTNVNRNVNVNRDTKSQNVNRFMERHPKPRPDLDRGGMGVKERPRADQPRP